MPLQLVLREVKSYKPFHPILPGCLSETGHRFHDPMVTSRLTILF